MDNIDKSLKVDADVLTNHHAYRHKTDKHTSGRPCSVKCERLCTIAQCNNINDAHIMLDYLLDNGVRGLIVHDNHNNSPSATDIRVAVLEHVKNNALRLMNLLHSDPFLSSKLCSSSNHLFSDDL